MLRAERNTDGDRNPAFGGGRKISEVEQAWLWNALQADRECPSRQVLDRVVERQAPWPIGVRQVNRWRIRWQCARRKGRPRKATGAVVASVGSWVPVLPLTHIGVHLWAAWLDQPAGVAAIGVRVQAVATAL